MRPQGATSQSRPAPRRDVRRHHNKDSTFDYFNLADGQFAFTLGDVAGKGPSAALLTAMIQGAFAAQVTSTDSPAALMAHINRTLIRRAIQARFVTVMYGVLAPDGRLTYSNAGHNPPILIGRTGVRRLETGGLILGLFPHATYEQETLQLEDGDTLVVFSDGVTDALNGAGDEFGEGRDCARAAIRNPEAVVKNAL